MRWAVVQNFKKVGQDWIGKIDFQKEWIVWEEGKIVIKEGARSVLRHTYLINQKIKNQLQIRE